MPLPNYQNPLIYQNSIESFPARSGRLWRVSLLVYGLLVFALPGGVFADSNFQYSGFGTFGLTLEHEDDLAFLRDNNQSKDPEKDASPLPDSILGLQLSAGFTPQWRATTQFTYRDRPEQDLDAITELAFIGYRPVPDLEIRLGRVSVDMFQLSDYRRVDYANLWVRPPTEVYGWILPSTIDGGDITYSYVDEGFFWSFKLQHGDTSPLLEFPDGSDSAEIEFNDYVVATIALDYQVWRGRISYSRAKPKSDTPPFIFALQSLGGILPGAVGEEAAWLSDRLLSSASREVRYWQASLSYDDGDWLIDTELTRLSTSGSIVPTGIAGYVSVGHRVGVFTPYAVYSRYAPDQDPYESKVDWSASGFEILRDAAIGTLNGVLIRQYTHTLGVRWDLDTGLAIKAQWDRSYIEKHQYALWAHANGKAHSDARVDVFSIAFNFIF